MKLKRIKQHELFEFNEFVKISENAKLQINDLLSKLIILFFRKTAKGGKTHEQNHKESS